MEPNVSLDEYGFVVAADAFAQMIFSPLLGIIADKVGAIRGVCLFCTITFCGGNVFYALLALIPQQVDGLAKPRVWAMLVSRFIVGIGTGINAAARYCPAIGCCFSLFKTDPLSFKNLHFKSHDRGRADHPRFTLVSVPNSGIYHGPRYSIRSNSSW